MRATLVLLLALGGALALLGFFLWYAPTSRPKTGSIGPSVASPQPRLVGPLRFAWPTEGRAVVRSGRNDETTVESFDLEWRTLSSGMLLVERYWITPYGARDPAVRGNWVFPDQALVSGDGLFVSNPGKEAHRAMLAALAGAADTCPPEEEQSELVVGGPFATRLRDAWWCWVETWLGLEPEPGEFQELPPSGRFRSRVRCASLERDGTVRMEHRRVSSMDTPQFVIIDELLGKPPGTSGPPDEPVECWVESEVGTDALIRIDGLLPLEIRTWLSTTYRRSPGGTDAWGTSRDESILVFDWDPPEDRPELLAVHDELQRETLTTQARASWPELDEDQLQMELEWMDELWRQLPARRRARLSAVMAAAEPAVDHDSISLDQWHAIRPHVRRLWLGE